MRGWNPEFVAMLKSRAESVRTVTDRPTGADIGGEMRRYKNAAIHDEFMRAHDIATAPESKATAKTLLEWCLDKLVLGVCGYGPAGLENLADWEAIRDLTQALRGKDLCGVRPALVDDGLVSSDDAAPGTYTDGSWCYRRLGVSWEIWSIEGWEEIDEAHPDWPIDLYPIPYVLQENA